MSFFILYPLDLFKIPTKVNYRWFINYIKDSPGNMNSQDTNLCEDDTSLQVGSSEKCKLLSMIEEAVA